MKALMTSVIRPGTLYLNALACVSSLACDFLFLNYILTNSHTFAVRIDRGRKLEHFFGGVLNFGTSFSNCVCLSLRRRSLIHNRALLRSGGFSPG